MIELLKQMVNNQTPNITFEIHDNKISAEDDIYRLTEEIMKQMDFILNVKNTFYIIISNIGVSVENEI